jgi:hypothetical protein
MLRRIAYGTAALTLFAGGIAVAQDFNLPPTFGEVTLTTGFAPVAVELQAGGPIDAAAAQLGEACLGQIADAPDYRIQFTAGTLPLVISVLSAADTTLLVNGPDAAWTCNDDTDGLNPAITFDAPLSGQYDIWVGTYVAAGETPAATLTIAEAGGAAPAPVTPGAAGAMPDFNLPPTFGQVELVTGFTPDPATVELNAGGTTDAGAANLGEGCLGFIATAPDYRVIYTAGALPLIFHVVAEADTTLVINGPDGNWYCNDDATGLNPMVTFEAPVTGQYDVWVGTYGAPGATPAVLNITEIPLP